MPIGITAPLYVGLSSLNRIRRVLITQRSDIADVGVSNFSLDDVPRAAIRR